MTDSNVRPFDFREIAALDGSATWFRDWISKSSSFFSEFWEEATTYSAQLSLGKIVSESYGQTLESLSKENLYTVANVAGEFDAIWYASSAELRSITSEMLYLSEYDENDASELSPIERSLSEFFVEEISRSLSNGWLGDDAITVETRPLERDPRKTRLFRSKDLVTHTSISIQLRERVTQLHMALPKQPMCNLLNRLIEHRSDSQPAVLSERMIQRVPVEVVAFIGSTQMSMSKLADLKAGQLIKLDQRIDQPITAYINETPLAKAWPGRFGTMQSIEITDCLIGSEAPESSGK